MPRIDNTQISFADQQLQHKIDPESFTSIIKNIVDWDPIKCILDQAYPKGLEHMGRKAHHPLVLFKMSLLQTWNGLSDRKIEKQVNDSLSFMDFCGISVTDSAPDSTVLCRFRKELTEQGTYDKLLVEINRQLEEKGIIVNQGIIADASITITPRKPKGKKTYHLPEGEYTLPLKEVKKKGVDPEASWVKRGNRLSYGYKRHYAVEANNGLVLSVYTSKASEHESKHLSSLLDKLDLSKGTEILADKGYSSKANESLLHARGLKSRIQRKRERGKRGDYWLGLYNGLIGKRRYKVERVFGSIKSWFKTSGARYVGAAKTHSQHVLEALSYNLWRSPGLYLSASRA